MCFLVALSFSGSVVDAANWTAMQSMEENTRVEFVVVHDGPAVFYFNAAAAEVLARVRRSPSERHVAKVFVEALASPHSPGYVPLVLECVLVCS